MNPLRLMAFFTVVFLVACGDRSSTEVDSVAPPVELVSLPDPCNLLTPSLAAKLLGSEKLAQKNLQNDRARSRICSYKEEGTEKMLFLSLMLFAPGTMSSATDTKEALIEKASRLAGGIEPSAVLYDIGNIAFVFDQVNATRVQVLTGIGGALSDGAPPAELQLGYAINLPDSVSEQRQTVLTSIARDHMKALSRGL
jgi:hypothetical protein